MYLIRNACQRGKEIRNHQGGDIKYYQKLDYLRLKGENHSLLPSMSKNLFENIVKPVN